MVVYMLRTIGKLEQGRIYDVPLLMAEKMIEKQWAANAETFKPHNKMMPPLAVTRR